MTPCVLAAEDQTAAVFVSVMVIGTLKLSGSAKGRIGTSLQMSRSRTVYSTGLLSSLGVRGSCWLVSAVSESCSDTETNQNKDYITAVGFALTLRCTGRGHMMKLTREGGSLTSFACLSGKSSRQLALYLLEKKKCQNTSRVRNTLQVNAVFTDPQTH